MTLSRRLVIRRLGMGAAAAVVIPSIAEASSVGAARGDGAPAADARPTGGPIRLNTTHNAYGPSLKTMAAIQQALARAREYPDAEPEELRTKIANLHGVSREQVVLGCGAGDILRMTADAFTGPRTKLVICIPTFDLIARYALRAGAAVAVVSLNKDFSHDLEAVLAECDSSTGLVYICNPNNPTGSLTRRTDIESFLGKLPAGVHVVIDEAYHHYVDRSSNYMSFIDRPVDDNRVIAVRSFSKIYGLAGMRVGYAIASSRVTSRLALHRLEGNVSTLAAKAAVASLDDVEYVQGSNRRNINDRQEFSNRATARMLKGIDSHTNFVMLKTEISVTNIVDHFKKYDILLPRPFVPLAQHLRVSLGTPAEMAEFWRVWDLMPVPPNHAGRM